MSVANAPGGSSYGSILQPLILAAQAAVLPFNTGGAGGGAMKVTVTGKLQLDGRISANGGDSPYEGGGGGSGGSIWLIAGTLSGGGIISARGAPAITLKEEVAAVDESQFITQQNNFGGTMCAYGGAGAVYGGAEQFIPTPTASRLESCWSIMAVRSARTPR